MFEIVPQVGLEPTFSVSIKIVLLRRQDLYWGIDFGEIQGIVYEFF